jgi:predicted AAA+ superfamily ATPase
MKRLYEAVIEQHLRENRQMLFLMGPRQVGKTTSSLAVGKRHGRFLYFNWDDQRSRRLILEGQDRVAQEAGFDRLAERLPVVVFDEIHKYSGWKVFLKGLFDTYPDRLRLLVTGSARLDVYKAGGDSLMGRYFGYRMHPLSVAEVLDPALREGEVRTDPQPMDDEAWDALIRFGGFPEPFLRSEVRFFNRWRRLRTEQLFKEELRDLTRIQELGQIEMLALMLRERVGQLVSYSSLARQVSVSVDTVKRWLETLGKLYYCFPVRPWFRNISRALRKEPKYYLWDWSLVEVPGARLENLVASALLKAVHFWTDHGLGEYGLHYVRDKEKREVDFLVVRNREPWFLVEVKSSGGAPMSKSLRHFQAQTGAPYAFQVAMDLPYVDADCFSRTGTPLIVPARTFLSELV